ncbi:MAG: hypothetical protein R3F60_00005 [bacterium]
MARTLPLAVFALCLAACGSGSKEDPADKFMKASCKSDDACAEGFICEMKDGNGTCVKGERDKAALAAKAKAEEEERKAKEAAKRETKPGEGRLEVRICPLFKNTPEAIGTIIAKNVETGKETYIHMAREVPDLSWQDIFTFWSLPLGAYEVTATYGIQVKGRAEVVKLKCYDKVKKSECKDEVIRLMEVVPPDQLPAPEKDKDGNVIKKPCDWIVE